MELVLAAHGGHIKHLVCRHGTSQRTAFQGGQTQHTRFAASQSLSSVASLFFPVLFFLIPPFPSRPESGRSIQLGGLGRAVSFRSRVWGGAPAAKAFLFILK